MFTLKMSTSSAAFHNEDSKELDQLAERDEVRRILSKVSNAIDDGKSFGKCLDYNGNVVGSWALETTVQ